MEDLWVPLVIVVVVGGVIAFGVYSYLKAKKRREDLGRIAGELGLEFNAVDPLDIANRYEHLEPLAQGHNRRAYNVVHGQRDDNFITAFDYVYYTTQTSTDSQGKTTSREVAHYFSAVIFQMGTVFPPLFIRPENFLDKIASAVGFDDIDFESAEFSRRFFVKSGDKKFAYDVIHPRMMEYLLKQPGWTLQLEGVDFLIHTGAMLKPDEFAAGIHHAEAFLKQIPDFVLERIRGS